VCGAASIDPAVVSKREGSEAAEARRSSEKPVAVNQQQYSHAIQGKAGSSDVGSEPAEPARTNAPPRRAGHEVTAITNTPRNRWAGTGSRYAIGRQWLRPELW
jgi:hypothetical protein